jgi:chromosomal replication initiator protein
MAKPETIWETALGELQLQMTKATFDTWVKQTSVLAYEDGTFIIGVQNGYAKDWLENRLAGSIKRTLTSILNRSVEVKFVVQSQTPLATEPVDALKIEVSGALGEQCFPDHKDLHDLSQISIRPEYTFERFVVGSSNRLAHAASRAVAEKPATAYNPLFLYGGVGLGKTHLLHAIGHHAVADGFFHTFNTLHSSGRQIVVSSDRPPQSITTLEERLASRFQWGLIADVQPPDLETRMAILRLKAELRDTDVPDEVLYLIARQMQNNIRELEGGLNRVLAHASLTHESITPEMAHQTLSTLVHRKERISVSEIIDTVAEHYGITQDELIGPCRQKEFVLPRQIVMYLAREETTASFPEIGQALGGRDHTTVLHGSQKMSREIEKKNSLRRDLIAIRESLYREPSPTPAQA